MNRAGLRARRNYRQTALSAGKYGSLRGYRRRQSGRLAADQQV